LRIRRMGLMHMQKPQMSQSQQANGNWQLVSGKWQVAGLAGVASGKVANVACVRATDKRIMSLNGFDWLWYCPLASLLILYRVLSQFCLKGAIIALKEIGKAKKKGQKDKGHTYIIVLYRVYL